jgi:hypothetical protein
MKKAFVITVIVLFSATILNAQSEKNENYKSYNEGDILKYDGNANSNMMSFNHEFADADNCFVELSKDNKKIVVEVSIDGDVSYFNRLR